MEIPFALVLVRVCGKCAGLGFHTRHLGHCKHTRFDRSDASSGWRSSALTLVDELSGTEPPLVLDVRTPREWATKYINGSVNLPLDHLRERIAEVPRDRRIAVHCAGGYRSSIAASILYQHGITNLIEMAGGLAAWDADKLPVVAQLSNLRNSFNRGQSVTRGNV